ncbi:MAG: T9SS type A sorting domain-containing protein, partial [Ignavibacteriaceae bacterium]|nr:T9SS type A sorting domain-containing protein [Ignavibacteriaceae bacterium]
GNQSAPSEEIFINLTSVTTNDLMTINDYRLYQNYPNPFNPSTVIPFRLKEKSYAKLRVYNINGELVSVLVNKVMEAGYHEVTFEVNKTDEETDKITKIASGIYLYKLDVINDRNIPFYSEVKKMLFIK